MARQRADDPRRAIQDHRTGRAAHRDGIRLGRLERFHLHVPGEVLVLRDDIRHVEAPLRDLGAEEHGVPGRLEERLQLFRLGAEHDVPDVIADLRSSRGDDVLLRIAPHHVLTGHPYIQGGPAGFATAVAERLDYGDGDGAGVRVAVIDTGYTPKLHEWLDAHVEAAPDTLEDSDVNPSNGWLDDESGHGTFITGLILERAPSATVRIAKVLDSEGYGRELDVAHAIAENADADVINLSLGCYSNDDLPPLALQEALRRVAPTTAVVAAAGNDGTDRPNWPAAHKRVIAVAAVDSSGRRAPFSNHGWWVDAAAPGVDILSTFVDFDESQHAVPIKGRVPQSFRGWARWSGTSFAAPRLAGEIAARTGRDGAPARAVAAALLAGGSTTDGDVGVVFDI